MYYKKFEADDLLAKKTEDKQFVKLMERENSQLKLVSIKKDDEIEAHTSETDACIYVIDGEIEIIFSKEDSCGCSMCGCDMADEDDDDAKKYKIKKNQMFMFEKEVVHSVKAVKDSVFLLIKM